MTSILHTSILGAIKIEDNEMRIKQQLFVFLLVGAISTCVDFLVYFSMIRYEVNNSFSKTVSFLFGTSIGYLGNSRFTFSRSSGSVTKYFVVYFLSLSLNVGINNLAYSTSSSTMLSWLLATFSSTCMNFVGLRYFACARQV